MNNKQLIAELLAEKDPETLMRKVHALSPHTMSSLLDTEEGMKLVEIVGSIIYKNHDIRDKILKETEELKYQESKKPNTKDVWWDGTEAHNG